MTQQKSHIDDTQLMQFLLGEASAEQMQQIDKWLHDSEENQKTLDQLESIWAESGKLIPNPVAVDPKAAWTNMSLRIDDHEARMDAPKETLRTGNIVRFIYGAAAILLMAFGLFKWVIEPKLAIDQLAFTTQQKMFKGKLPDGSEVALNLNSKLSYPERFRNNTREVTLEGEAFFDVTHNPRKPFVIRAGEARIKVLGTSFNVKAQPESPIEVSVSTGRVLLFRVDSLSGDTASVFLRAGEKGILPHRGAKPEKLDEPIEPDEMFWMDRTLVFKQVKLSKVLTMLEKHYGMNILVENKMALDCKYTATFTNADIEDILEMIANTFNFELILEDKVYIFKGNGCLDD